MTPNNGKYEWSKNPKLWKSKNARKLFLRFSTMWKITIFWGFQKVSVCTFEDCLRGLRRLENVENLGKWKYFWWVLKKCEKMSLANVLYTSGSKMLLWLQRVRSSYLRAAVKGSKAWCERYFLHRPPRRARLGVLHQPLMRQNPIEQALFGEY